MVWKRSSRIYEEGRPNGEEKRKADDKTRSKLELVQKQSCKYYSSGPNMEKHIESKLTKQN